MNTIVLAKLVPDIRHIPPDAWDLRRGTLRRNKLRLIPNPMDDRALRFALAVREVWGGTVTVLSMGPPAAADLCYRALAYGADSAVLVSDPACAGADTLATSHVLARAIAHIQPAGSPLIFSGMQSPDGDTAQVPVQVAALLGLHVVPYVTDVRITDGSLELSGIGSGGSVETRLDRNVASVITCTDQLPSLPFHLPLPSLIRAARHGISRLTATDLELDKSRVGLAGSATRVVTIAVADSVRRESTFIDWAAQSEQGPSHLAEVLRRSLQDGGGAVQRSKPAPRRTGEPSPPSGPGGAVWAVMDPVVDPDRLGILDHARKIADQMDVATVAVVVESGGMLDTRLAEIVSKAGATEVLQVSRSEPSHGNGKPGPLETAHCLEAASRHFAPRVILLPASPEGRVSAPYLAARLDAGLTADCTDFEVGDYRMRKNGTRRTFPGTLFQIRPALGGNIQATIVSPVNIENGLPQLATVRPGPSVDHAPPGSFSRIEWISPESDDRGARDLVSRAADHARSADAGVDIARCKVLVSVGRGVSGPDQIDTLAGSLVTSIRRRFDVEVELAASRMVVDRGDLERDRQVGQTGNVVAPDVYIALGISGAAQHRAGMEGSATIIAVNSDEEAPIRHISDVFVHGRVEEVVPALINALEEMNG